MARQRPPDWDDDSAALRRNLVKVATSIERDAAMRVLPTLNMAKQWHRQIMVGLAVQEPQVVGRFRGEAGLEDCWVQVDGAYGSAPERVGAEAKAFEAALQRRLALLDATYCDAQAVDDDGQSAAIELAAWAHAVWIRIHPFANGNGRTARIWANVILMRYGLPPAVALRPRPGGEYAAAGAAALQGQWRPTVDVFRRLVRDCLAGL